MGNNEKSTEFHTEQVCDLAYALKVLGNSAANASTLIHKSIEAMEDAKLKRKGFPGLGKN